MENNRPGWGRRDGALAREPLLEPSDAMELYLDLNSQPCRSVFLFAKAVGIPFKFNHVDLISGKLCAGASSSRRNTAGSPIRRHLGYGLGRYLLL